MALNPAAATDRSNSSPRVRPLTGAEYLESVRDGREIWIYGERVKDVTTHPAFANAARMYAAMYDLKADPAKRELMSFEGLDHQLDDSAARTQMLTRIGELLQRTIGR